jgi:hypothetical protein
LSRESSSEALVVDMERGEREPWSGLHGSEICKLKEDGVRMYERQGEGDEGDTKGFWVD